MDIAAAKRDGYTDDEIMAELAKRHNMDIQSALKDGYSKVDIYDELARRDNAKTGITPPAITSETPEWAGKYPNLYGILGATKELARMGGEYAGMGLGAAGGALLGGPAGAVVGAGVGLGATKMVENVLEGKPQNVGDLQKDVAVGMLGQAMPAVAKGITDINWGGIAGKVSRKIMGVGEEALAKIATVKEQFGIVLTSAQATGSRGLGLYESLLDKTPFSASIIDESMQLKQLKPLLRLREKALEENNYQSAETLGLNIQKQVSVFVDKLKITDVAKREAAKQRIIDKLGSPESFENLGKSAIEVVEQRSAEALAKKNAVYAEIGEFIPKEKVTTPELARVAKKNLDEIMKGPNQDATLVKNLRWSAQQNEKDLGLANEIRANYPPELAEQIIQKQGLDATTLAERDWATLQRFRIDLNDLIKNNNPSMKAGVPSLMGQSNNNARVYGELKAALDKDMEAIAKNTGGEAWDKLQAANAFFKEEYAPLWKRASIIRKVATSNPGAVADVVLQPRNILEVDLLKKAMGDEAFAATIKPAITNKLIGKSQVFDPKELASSLEKYGDEVLGKIYTAPELTFLKKMAAGEGIDMAGPIPFSMKGLINDISKRVPSTVVDAIVGTGTDKVTNPARLIENLSKLRMMVDKETLKGINGELANRIFRVSPKTDYVEPAALSAAVERMKPALKIFMEPEQVKWLDDLSKVTKNMSLAQSRAANPSGTAQNIIAWGAYGYILNQAISASSDISKGDVLGALGHVGKAGVAIITPRAMARIYLSDPGRKLFMEGIRTPVGTARGATIAAKLAVIAGTNIENEEP